MLLVRSRNAARSTTSATLISRGRDARKEFVADVLSFANAAGATSFSEWTRRETTPAASLGIRSPQSAHPCGPLTTRSSARSNSACATARPPAARSRNGDRGRWISERSRGDRARSEEHGGSPPLFRRQRLYSRATTGKYQLDVRQLRGVFVEAAEQEAPRASSSRGASSRTWRLVASRGSSDTRHRLDSRSSKRAHQGSLFMWLRAASATERRPLTFARFRRRSCCRHLRRIFPLGAPSQSRWRCSVGTTRRRERVRSGGRILAGLQEGSG